MEQKKPDARIVSGYCFAGEDDAELAKQEVKKIAYLEKHMDYTMPDKILQVYKKSIEERIFKTPVGYEYLKNMQEFLLESENIDNREIEPIRLYVNFQPRMRKNTSPVQNRIQAPAEKRKLRPLSISIALNIALAIAVCAMFVIALKSDNPNILNYENALTNKYSAWEQELSEREQAVRERERELNLER